MKKIISGILMLIITFCMTACGNTDVLKGTWEGTYEDGNASLTFDGKGKCSITTMVLSESSCEYKILNDKDVDIKLDIWDNPLLYHYTIDGKNLKLVPDNSYSPHYEVTKK